MTRRDLVWCAVGFIGLGIWVVLYVVFLYPDSTPFKGP